MKKILIELYRRNKYVKKLLSLPVLVYRKFCLSRLNDQRWCEVMFKASHGYDLELQNTKTLNEKIQWLKLNNRRSDYSQYVDKYEVRKFIESQLGGEVLIPLLRSFDKGEQVNLEGLEFPYIVKSNHASGQYKILRSPEDFNLRQLRKDCQRWLEVNYYEQGREWQYRDVKPKIVVEKLLVSEGGEIPYDYKFHCIHGEIVAIQVDLDRMENHKRNFYDTEWNLLPFTWSVCAGDQPLWGKGKDVDRPSCLDELIEKTKILSKSFPYIRVDWYVLDGAVYFGELTFHHGGGFERILPMKWDYELGGKLDLTK